MKYTALRILRMNNNYFFNPFSSVNETHMHVWKMKINKPIQRPMNAYLIHNDQRRLIKMLAHGCSRYFLLSEFFDSSKTYKENNI